MSDFEHDEMARLQKQYAVACDSKIAEQLSAEIQNSESRNKRRLIKDNPFEKYQSELAAAKGKFGQGVYDLPSIQSDFAAYKELAAHAKINANESYWAKEIEKIKTKEIAANNAREMERQLAKIGKVKKSAKTDGEKLETEKKTIRELLQRRWQKTLDEQYADWELKQIADYRRELLKKLQNWLELMQQLADVLSQLCIEPGVLFDLSKDNLSFSDVAEIKRWAEYLTQDEGARRLCEMLGRLRVAANSKRREWVKTVRTFSEVHPDINSREEIVGVRIGKDIEHALPQELALLSDDDTALLFDIKFVESRLMCFDMTGLTEVDKTVEEDELTEVTEEEKMGPVIICVDTSGSMHGLPETVAKAVTLYMATMAIDKKRDCFLINFSTGIETMDLSGHVGVKNLIEFLRKSFGGGTDVAPAVAGALEKMKEENYQKSDLLIVSDFVMGDLPEEHRAAIAEAKQNGNKFYSLSIGDMFLESVNRDIFDGEWVYNPGGGIRQLLDIVDTASI